MTQKPYRPPSFFRSLPSILLAGLGYFAPTALVSPAAYCEVTKENYWQVRLNLRLEADCMPGLKMVAPPLVGACLVWLVIIRDVSHIV